MLPMTSNRRPFGLIDALKRKSKNRELAPFLVSLFGAGFLFSVSYLFGSRAEEARLLLGFALIPNLYLLTKNVISPKEGTLGIMAVLYCTQFLIVPGLFQAAVGYFPFYNMSYSDHSLIGAAFIILLFSLSFTLFYVFPFAKRRKSEDTVEALNSGRLLFIFGAFLVLGLAIFALLRPATFLTRIGDNSYDDLSPATLLEMALGRVSGFQVLALSLILLIRARAFDAKVVCWLLASVGAAIFMLLNFPLNVTRFLLFGWLIALGFLWVNSKKAAVKGVFCLLLVVGTCSVFPLISNLSRGGLDAELLNPAAYLTTSGDVDGFQSSANIFEMVESNGAGLGKHLLSAVLFFVPRSVWPDKSFPTGVEAARFRGYNFTNISAPLPSELYSDFGLIGVVIGAAFFGFGFQWVEHWLEESNKGEFGPRRLVVGTMAGFTIILFRGPILGIIGPVAVAIGTAVLVYRVISYRKRIRGRRRMSPTALVESNASLMKSRIGHG